MLKENYTCTAAEFVVYPPTFIDYIPKVKLPIQNKFKKTLERIVKIDVWLKDYLLNFRKNKKNKIVEDHKKIIQKSDFKVIAYPESDIQDVLMIMNSLKLTSLPVAENPWNKRLVGFVEKNSIEKEIEENKLS